MPQRIDEPFAGLRMDEIVGQQALLRAVAQRTTLVVASRSIFGFSELCKRTIVLNKGRIANESGSNLFARTDAKARVRLRVACAPAKAKAAFQFIPGILDIDFRSAPEKGVWDILIDSDGRRTSAHRCGLRRRRHRSPCWKCAICIFRQRTSSSN